MPTVAWRRIPTSMGRSISNQKEQDNMTRHQQTLLDCKQALADGELFLLKYESKLPEDLGDFYVASYGVRFEVRLGGRSDTQREKALCYLGDVFGRSGWEATLGYGGSYFNWHKLVDGVVIQIEAAQMTGTPKSFPVDPKQFPLQLADINQEVE